MNLVLTRQPLAPLITAETAHSPTSGRGLFCLACVLFVLWFPALAFDLPVARFVKEHRAAGEVHKLLAIAETFSHGYGVLAILVAAAALDPRGWRIVPRLLPCSLGAGGIADIVKLFVCRFRPKAAPLEGSVWETFAAWLPAWNPDALPRPWDAALQSFPSGHTAAGVGLAIGLCALYPRGRWLFITLAILGAMQRIESQSHFVSDTVAGAAIAALIGAVCFAQSALGSRFTRLETAL